MKHLGNLRARKSLAIVAATVAIALLVAFGLVIRPQLQDGRKQITILTATDPGSAARRRASRSASANTTSAPESARAKTISSVCHQAFIGTAIAPTEVIAAKAATHSG